MENKLNGAEGDPKQTWRILKEVMNGKSQQQIKSVKVDGRIVKNPEQIAEKMNSFYVESINAINRSIPTSMPSSPLSSPSSSCPLCSPSSRTTNATTITTFKFRSVSWVNIEKHLSLLNDKRDVDFVDPKIILDCMDVIGPTLLQLVNESLKYGEVPDIFKTSTVCMVPKITKPKVAEDYRPINMLITLEKLLESIVKEQLTEYIETNKVLSVYQSGYRKLHSCETALNLVISKWKEMRDKNYDVICVFLDLKRAFETIDRNRLLCKLEGFGVKNSAYRWFESYLKGRTQRTKVNGSVSEAIPNELGVPQGSIIGALAFILYINEMPNVVKDSFINLFADDTLLYAYGTNVKSIVRKVNEDLARVYKWLCVNKLKLNIDKTKCMYISKNGSLMKNDIVVNGEKIELVRNIKYLGVIIDDSLRFDENAKYVNKKVASKIFLLGRISKNLTLRARRKIYQSIITPHFQYCPSLLFAFEQ